MTVAGCGSNGKCQIRLFIRRNVSVALRRVLGENKVASLFWRLKSYEYSME